MATFTNRPMNIGIKAVLVIITLLLLMINANLYAQKNIIRLKGVSAGVSDETVVRMRSDATDQFDSKLDAYKLSNGANTPNFYTRINDVNYAINSLPIPSETFILPVKFEAKFDGSYSIETSLQDFDSSSYSLVLEDRLLNVKQDIEINPNYNCELTVGDTTSRFFLHLIPVNGSDNTQEESTNSNFSTFLINDVSDKKESLNVTIYNYENLLTIDFGSNHPTVANIVVQSLKGEQILLSENISINAETLQINLPQSHSFGMYVVKVISQDQMKSQKICF